MIILRIITLCGGEEEAVELLLHGAIAVHDVLEQAVLLLLPGASSVIFGLALSLAQAVGLSPPQVFQGLEDFRFWARLGA